MIKRVILSILLFSGMLQVAPGQQLFTVDQMKTDLEFYKRKLMEYHPDLYLYSSKNKIDSCFDSLSSLLTKPLTELEFYRIITLTSNAVKDGHTLILPSGETTEIHNENSKFLPYQIGIIGNELYIQMNCTNEKNIPDGSIISSINGIPSENIIQHLSERQVRDGHNLSYTYWILDNYFREYYSFHYGHPDTFDIVYKENKQSNQVKISALIKDSIYTYRSRNYPNFTFEKNTHSGLTLQIDNNDKSAILTIKDFHTDVLKNDYNQHFKPTISKIFEEIIENNTQNLILDLRNNQGGDVENGVLLLSYILDKPFRVINEYNRVKSKKLVNCKGPSMGIHKPKKKHYKGNLFVLVNGGSFSNSVIVASCIKANNRAIFIGTETGGNPNILAGYAKDFELPNTKINIEIPTKQFVMTSTKQNNGEGLIPDYIVMGSISDKLQQIDSEMNFIIEQIKQ